MDKTEIFTEYDRQNARKHDVVFKRKTFEALKVEDIDNFRDCLREGETYILQVEKLTTKEEKNVHTEWRRGKLVKKYPHIAAFQIGDRRWKETFMYKDLYRMAKEEKL